MLAYRLLMVPRNMNKIKLLVSAGIDFPAAVKASLGMSLREFAEKHSVPETAVSGLINGSTPYPQNAVRDALATEFGVDRSWIDEQVEQHAANPDSASAA